MKKSHIQPRLANNELIEISGTRYRAEFWQHPKENFYEFINVSDNDLPNFSRSEILVSEAIKTNKIKRLN